MKKMIVTAAITLLFVSAGSAQPSQAFITGFWTALVSGDTASLRTYYDDSVVVQLHSELLKNRWGLCSDTQLVVRQITDSWQDTAFGGAISTKDTTFSDTVVVRSCGEITVDKDVFLSALDSLVQSFGGKWSTVMGAVPTENMAQQILSATSVKLSYPTGNADDVLEFVFETPDGGTTWYIISELTDY
jgi:hypothetical protein